MSKHTFAPWDVDPNDKFSVTADCDGLQVCSTEFEDRDDDENAANARLIAAAPELLEALQALGGHPEHGYCYCLNQEQIQNGHTGECREARAAIAKAEGRP
jgi:hypothetical protein